MSTTKKKKLAKKTKTKPSLLIIGWNEWVTLPKLKIPLIKAKIDTGAKTSALHAFNIKPFIRYGAPFVKFNVLPLQHDDLFNITCRARVVDHRYVMSSNGQKEKRYVINTTLFMGEERWAIEITLSNRDPLTYRMLLGREAFHPRIRINPNRSLLLGKKLIKEYY